ncbi:MAG: hypothetical protein H6Q25_999 [Bacteroidetes bacterium]|nr:hypothetical protein [Bacteroidota bacterium]
MKSKKIYLIISGILILCINSCTSENDLKNISDYLSTRSHNMGMNCMNCHNENGAGNGWFEIAGTIYDSLLVNTYSGATVKLYTGPNGTGTLVYTIEVDTKGNFHTTEMIDFNGGLHPVVEGNTGNKSMASTLCIGACNSCHGSTTGRIWTR